MLVLIRRVVSCMFSSLMNVKSKRKSNLLMDKKFRFLLNNTISVGIEFHLIQLHSGEIAFRAKSGNSLKSILKLCTWYKVYVLQV